ncbi:MAG: four helix bundle protein [Bacteroidetes bacterium]|nr:four helix bundle protein [Bacteroidota bacterium]
MFEFQKLEVYKKAKSFHKDAAELISTIKPNKTVKDQLSRASFSIVLNIAEGSGRFSKPDRRNFFVIARGSVFECVAILDVLHDQQLINEPGFDSFLKKADVRTSAFFLPSPESFRDALTLLILLVTSAIFSATADECETRAWGIFV